MEGGAEPDQHQQHPHFAVAPAVKADSLRDLLVAIRSGDSVEAAATS